jgi:hypothetical protein
VSLPTKLKGPDKEEETEGSSTVESSEKIAIQNLALTVLEE